MTTVALNRGSVAVGRRVWWKECAGTAPAMTTVEVQELADRLAAEYTRHLDYIRTTTVVMALMPMLYGTLTWVFGDALWGGSPVYRAALETPWAPESWGTVFLILAAGIVVASFKRHPLAMAAGCGGMALTLAMFMMTFMWTGAVMHNLSTIPPAIGNCVMSLLFLSRARLAWEGWRAGSWK